MLYNENVTNLIIKNNLLKLIKDYVLRVKEKVLNLFLGVE